MAHFLNINQLAEEASAQELTDIVTMLEDAANKAAQAIAAKRGDVGIVQDADNAPGFGGLCVGFGPVNEGDKCPEDFAEYDKSSDWAENA
jgi:hypothetical protein